MAIDEEKSTVERLSDVVNIDRDGVEKFAIIEESKDLKVFTSKDEVNQFCCDCKYRAECIMLQHINKLSMKRDGIPADKVWGCTTFKEEDR